MSHSKRIFSLSALLLILINGIVTQTVADPVETATVAVTTTPVETAPVDNTPAVLITEEDQVKHQTAMRNMSAEERMAYRNEQYAALRNKAAAIGYNMPEKPPWAEMEAKSATSGDFQQQEKSRHQQQLEKYRQAAAEKREAMQERLAKQREHIKQRIAHLIEKNAVKPTPEQPYQGFRQPPSFQPAPVAPMHPMGPAYPRFYSVPPPMPMQPYPY